MSGGEQQMLAIARALMGRPRLLLLFSSESTGHLIFPNV
jgi:ABC-type branched-subunit amino acid transport system ATPase component